jgi:putative ABC transport system ATP-binding protein
MALVGPSGSGKSTFLRALSRLIELDSGTILFRGTNITDMDPVSLRRSAVFVHQESVMLPGSVRDNVLYGPRLVGKSDSCDVSRCLRDSGLQSGFANRYATDLSVGEKRRVSLARALALDPEVLLLDEPTSGVDPKRVKKIESTIINIANNFKLTVIWVTHNVSQAVRISQRIANLKDGKIKEVKNSSEFGWEGAY